MKTVFRSALAAMILLAGIISSCEKTSDPTPLDPPPGAGVNPPPGGGGASAINSIEEVYAMMGRKSESFQVSAVNGGSFTSAQGFKVKVPAAAFKFQNGTPVTSGNVSIEFKNIVSKSDIMFSGIHTVTSTGLLVSAGEFFIRAKQENNFLLLAKDAAIKVEIPAKVDPDSAMQPFIANDTAGAGGQGNPGAAWAWSGFGGTSQLDRDVSSYIFSLYKFSSPASGGTWCNVDNSQYFNAYQKVMVTIIPDPAQSDIKYDVFVVFTGLNSMVHMYSVGKIFPFPWAPEGLQCTVVAFGVKNGKLHSSFTPITISKDLEVNISLTETTKDVFQAKVKAMNNN